MLLFQLRTDAHLVLVKGGNSGKHLALEKLEGSAVRERKKERQKEIKYKCRE